MAARRETSSVLLASLVVACGLAPNERDIPAPAADGFGPFRDRGAVEICEGPLRLIPPDDSRAGGAGLCVPSDAPDARECASDSSCGPRERCWCGRCTVPRCGSASDCPPPMSCDLGTGRCTRGCWEDRDCPLGSTCEPEGCRAACRADGDCARGEVCLVSRGVCIAQGCDDATSCTAGRRCDRLERTADLHEPEAVSEAGRVELYVEERRTGKPPALLRAVSEDGVRFRVEPRGFVLTGAAAPSVLVSGDERLLVYARTDGTIGRATWNGQRFDAQEDPVLSPGASWEESGLGGPSICRDSERLLLAYDATDGGGIGIAASDDGGTSFTRVAGPFGAGFFEDADLFRSVGDVRSPDLRVVETPLGESLFVFHAAAVGVETSHLRLGDETRPAPPTASIVAAGARGDLRFEPYPFGPVLARVVDVTDYADESEPTLLVRGDEAWLYYVGAIGEEVEGIRLAVQERAGP